MTKRAKARVIYDDEQQSKAFVEAAKSHCATGEKSRATELIKKLSKRPPSPRKKK